MDLQIPTLLVSTLILFTCRLSTYQLWALKGRDHISDKNDGGDHNITANEDTDGVDSGNEGVNNNSIDGDCGDEGDGEDDNRGDNRR